MTPFSFCHPTHETSSSHEVSPVDLLPTPGTTTCQVKKVFVPLTLRSLIVTDRVFHPDGRSRDYGVESYHLTSSLFLTLLTLRSIYGEEEDISLHPKSTVTQKQSTRKGTPRDIGRPVGVQGQGETVLKPTPGRKERWSQTSGSHTLV